MATPYTADLAGEAIEELLSQFRQQPNAAGFVRGLCNPAQTVEDNTLDLRHDRLLANAIGAQLDVCGALVGEPRGPLSDAEYRQILAARVLVNISGGNADNLISIFAAAAGPPSAGTKVVYRQLAGPAFMLTIIRDTHLSATQADRVRRFMVDICPAGVGMMLVEALVGAFTLDVGPGLDVGLLAGLI